jgi:hypothetical protein
VREVNYVYAQKDADRRQQCQGQRSKKQAPEGARRNPSGIPRARTRETTGREESRQPGRRFEQRAVDHEPQIGECPHPRISKATPLRPPSGEGRSKDELLPREGPFARSRERTLGTGPFRPSCGDAPKREGRRLRSTLEARDRSTKSGSLAKPSCPSLTGARECSNGRSLLRAFKRSFGEGTSGKTVG